MSTKKNTSTLTPEHVTMLRRAHAEAVEAARDLDTLQADRLAAWALANRDNPTKGVCDMLDEIDASGPVRASVWGLTGTISSLLNECGHDTEENAEPVQVTQ